MKWCLLACIVLGACGGAPALPTDGGTDLTPAGPCADKGGSPPDGGVCVTDVTGRLVDEAGGALGSLDITVCGELCSYGTSAGDGTFDAHISRHLLFDHYSLQVHGAPMRANYYAPLPPLVGDRSVFTAPIVVPLLPASGPLLALDGSAQTVTSGDVTLAIPANTNIQLSFDDVALMDAGRQFRALTIGAQPLPLANTASPPDALYALAPFEATFSQSVRLSFVNTAHLPPGSAVRVSAMRTVAAAVKPYGPFDPVATAHVSADGLRIDFDAGQGVTSLSWIAIVKGP